MPLVLPLGYHLTRFEFQCVGITDPMGFSMAFAPFSDGIVTEQVLDSIVARAFSTTWFAAADVSTAYTWTTVSDTQMLPDGPITEVRSVNEVGTNGGGFATPNVAILVRKVTTLGGRTNRGRLYMPPYRLLETNVTTDGVLIAAFQTALNADWEAFLAGIALDGLDPVLLHSSPAETPTAIQAYTVQSKVATQRRRLR